MSQRSEKIMVRLPPELRREVERAAVDEGRSLSNVVQRVLVGWAKQRNDGDHQQAAA